MIDFDNAPDRVRGLAIFLTETAIAHGQGPAVWPRLPARELFDFGRRPWVSSGQLADAAQYLALEYRAQDTTGAWERYANELGALDEQFFGLPDPPAMMSPRVSSTRS
jgi:hypothetical protein